MSTQALFKTNAGIAFPGVQEAAYESMLKALREDYGVSNALIAESASFSMAMVVRYALGLSAEGGKVCVIARDTLAGYVALATLRHLVCAGAEGHVLLFDLQTPRSTDLSQQLHVLEKMSVSIEEWTSATQDQAYAEFIGSCHNVLCGMYDASLVMNDRLSQLITILNESNAPIHSVQAPLGVNVDTGAQLKNPLFSSSTISLGAPFSGLSPGSDFVGRHYLCDISFDKTIYKIGGTTLCTLFSEQPVTQIGPVAPEELQSES